MTWKEDKKPQLELFPITIASVFQVINTVIVTTLTYREFPDKLPRPFLMFVKSLFTIAIELAIAMYVKLQQQE